MRKIFQPNRLKPGLLILLATALVAVLAFAGISVSGQTPTPAPTPAATVTGGQTVFGQVTGIATDNSSFTIQSDSQTPMTVEVDQNTTYILMNIPDEALSSIINMLESLLGEGATTTFNGIMSIIGGSGITFQAVSLAEITSGDFVTAITGANGSASQVIIMRFSNIKHVSGTITGMTGNSFTVSPVNGSAVTINWDENTHFLLKGLTAVQNGQTANVLYNGTTNLMIIALITSTSTPTPTSTAIPSATTAVTTVPGTTPEQVSVDASSTGKSITMSVGDTLVVTLQSNASTGFSWQLDQISDTSVLEKTNNQYVAPATPMPGAPGSEVWTFEALKSGTSAILMEYSQPFAGGIKGAQTFSLTVNVQ